MSYNKRNCFWHFVKLCSTLLIFETVHSSIVCVKTCLMMMPVLLLSHCFCWSVTCCWWNGVHICVTNIELNLPVMGSCATMLNCKEQVETLFPICFIKAPVIIIFGTIVFKGFVINCLLSASDEFDSFPLSPASKTDPLYLIRSGWFIRILKNSKLLPWKLATIHITDGSWYNG